MLADYLSHIKRSINIAGPCIFENIMLSLVTYTDAIMVGKLGAKETAAVAINSSPILVLNSLPMIFSIGGSVLVARNIGACNNKEASNVATQTIGSAVIFSAIVMVLMILISGYIPKLMGADIEIQRNAILYIRIYSICILAHFCGLVSAGLLRGVGNTKTPMLIAVFTNILNILGNYLLIYPTREISFLPFKIWGAGLGVTGAAISAVFAQSTAGLILLLYIFNNRETLNVNYRKIFNIKKVTINKVLLIGVPTSLERLALTSGQVFFQKMISGLGTLSVASHYIALTAESISYMPANGFSTASTTLISQSLGAKNKRDALIYSRINYIGACSIAVLGGIIFYVFSEQLVSIFSPDPEVIALSSKCLKIMAVLQPLLSFCIVSTGIFRGAGDTKFPLITGLIGIWGVRLAVAYYSAYVLNLGLVGAWIGMATDFFIRTIIYAIRYIRKKWLYINLD